MGVSRVRRSGRSDLPVGDHGERDKLATAIHGFRVDLAWTTAALCVALTVAGLVLAVVTRSTPVPVDFGSRGSSAVAAAVFVALPVLGALIASRRPEARLAWLFIAIGATMAAWVFADGYSVYAIVTRPGALPGARALAWLANWVWIPGWGMTALLFLLFPGGRMHSRRRRLLTWLVAGVTSGFTVATMLTEGPLANYRFIVNPIGVLGWRGSTVKLAGTLALGILGLIIVATLIPQFRDATGDRRQQFKWVSYGAAIAIGTTVGTWTLFALGARLALAEDVALAIPVVLPITAGVAVLKYRLYDLDVVINKTLVYTVLAGFVTVVYVAIVVGMGGLAGSPGTGSLRLSIAATAIVAVAFAPVRQRVQVLANRLVYGRRVTPYDALAVFSTRMAELAGTDQLVNQMAQVVSEATGAVRVQVWLRVGNELRVAASRPPGDAPSETLAIVGDELSGIPASDLAIPVRHRGELLGALAVTAAPGVSLRPPDIKLVSDLASQAGQVLRNVQLTEELRARLDELQISRQRLVTAQDDERRRIERDLHDGAQQYLVALRVQLGLTARMVEPDAAELRAMLDELQGLTSEALESLRTLARGIYPPLLADLGLVAALQAHGRRLPFALELTADGLDRYPRQTEAAVYFCCLEALQNASKYSGAAKVSVRLDGRGDTLGFSVADDGKGCDLAIIARGAGLQNMRDRVEALGGDLEVRSAAGCGTEVIGRVPVAATVSTA